MYKKYLIYRYIQKHGKGYFVPLCERFHVTDEYFAQLSQRGTNIDTEIKTYYDDVKNDSYCELTAAGLEYIAEIKRNLFLCVLGVVLAAIISVLIA